MTFEQRSGEGGVMSSGAVGQGGGEEDGILGKGKVQRSQGRHNS